MKKKTWKSDVESLDFGNNYNAFYWLRIRFEKKERMYPKID